MNSSMDSVDYMKYTDPYTKWHTSQSAEEIDLGPQPPGVIDGAEEHFRFPGKPKKHAHLMLIWLITSGLCVGLLVGFSARHLLQLHINFVSTRGTSRAHCEPFHGTDKFVQTFATLISSVRRENLNRWLWSLTRDSHVGGSHKGRELALKIRDRWASLPHARVEKYRPLLSYPDTERANEVRLLQGSKILYQMNMSPNETAFETHPYLAYSSPGKVRGKPVYVNFGREEDFDTLRTRGVTLNGTIAITRLGKAQILRKIQQAKKNGIKGVVLYRDPLDAESFESDFAGPSMPLDAIPRATLKSYPGDPATPYLPAVEDVNRQSRSDIRLPGIPVQLISAIDAQHLLKDLGGSNAPMEWVGKLNVSYSTGPGYRDAAEVEVQLSSFNLFREMDIYNVLGSIPGSLEPDQYVIIGSHHDSWARGAADPASGMAVLMEVVRAFSDLYHKTSWRPRRTLLFVAWDASHFGSVGSTEFLEQYSAQLSHAIAYLSLDKAVTGTRSLQVSGSPLLRQALERAAKQIPAIESRPGDSQQVFENLYASWLSARPALLLTGRGSVPEMLPPTGESDAVPFFQMLGIPVAQIQFVNRGSFCDYPVLDTAYDTYDLMANHIDVGQHAMYALTQLVLGTALELADSFALPFKVVDYANQISADFAVFQREHREIFRAHGVQMEPLTKSVKAFRVASLAFQESSAQNAPSTANNASSSLCGIFRVRDENDNLLRIEKSFLLPEGFAPAQPYSRHILYGIDKENSDRSLLFPHLAEAIRELRRNPRSSALHSVREHLSVALNALRKATDLLNRSLLTGKSPL
ncbi:N-acetylated-alpha-linked acidic dipeptidase 2 [Galendromus occidentalis]|uniref:N-acetylated-alpha-linked acidic dipeptidase 2 n=1 Tax=Galendromus occidentalis TaxID=34638 RepID=A0AAJ7SH87_9ACAR|nr:N-acetylated-alpha-linked acidic dipeptidase 2 [Galendromus occidentalis]